MAEDYGLAYGYGTDPYGHAETSPLRVTNSDAPTTTPLTGDYLQDDGLRIAVEALNRSGGRTTSSGDNQWYLETATRDDHQRLATRTNTALSRTTTFSYTTDGLLSEIIDGAGIHTIYAYESTTASPRRLSSVTRDSTGTSAQYAYGYAGAARLLRCTPTARSRCTLDGTT